MSRARALLLGERGVIVLELCRNTEFLPESCKNSSKLATLLGDRSADDFFATIWERAPIHHCDTFVPRDLLALDELEQLIASAAADTSSRLSIVEQRVARPLARGDAAANVAATFRAYAAGATLLLTELQHHWQPIARFARAIEGELHELGVALAQRIGANAYLTPPRAQGFDLHYDDHCVFILQLAGTKAWQVHAPNIELPVDRCTAAIPVEQLAPAILEVELAPGDVLYIPRGFPHAARSRETASLHLTLSLHTVTWLQLIAEAMRAHPALRRSVPRADAQALFDRELRAALAIDDIEARLQQRAGDFVSKLVPVVEGRLRAYGATIDLQTRVARVPGMLAVVARDGDEVIVKAPGATVRLPSAMEPALAFVARTASFAAADIPLGRAVFDRVQLVRILVQHGIVAPMGDAT